MNAIGVRSLRHLELCVSQQQCQWVICFILHLQTKRRPENSGKENSLIKSSRLSATRSSRCATSLSFLCFPTLMQPLPIYCTVQMINGDKSGPLIHCTTKVKGDGTEKWMWCSLNASTPSSPTSVLIALQPLWVQPDFSPFHALY